jgi:hypothetical protein
MAVVIPISGPSFLNDALPRLWVPVFAGTTTEIALNYEA